MRDTDYDKIIEITSVGSGFLPVNAAAVELADGSRTGEVISLLEVTKRDLAFHRAYFSLIHYIYDWLPISFKKQIPKAKFHQFLKHLRKEYDVVFTFADGSQIVEYKSISFAKLSQPAFKEYVRLQLPYVYSEVIEVLYPDKETSDRIIAAIENEYINFLSKL